MAVERSADQVEDILLETHLDFGVAPAGYFGIGYNSQPVGGQIHNH